MCFVLLAYDVFCVCSGFVYITIFGLFFCEKFVCVWCLFCVCYLCVFVVFVCACGC